MIFDGATGTALTNAADRYNCTIDELNVVAPKAVQQLHIAYINAGADYITTNSFGINPIKWRGQICTWQQAAQAAIANAKAIKHSAKIVFDISPTGKLIEPIGEMSFQEVYDNYAQLVEVTKGAVDGYILETFTDLYELKAAILALKEHSALPIFATMTFDSTLHTLSGSTPAIVAVTLDALGVDALGVNCSSSPEIVVEAVRQMRPYTTKPIIAQANKGLPQMVGGVVHYDFNDDDFLNIALELLDAGANIIGGCCGTEPSTIAKIAQLKQRSPKPINPVDGTYICSSTKLVKLKHGTICGERLNPTGKRLLKAALAEENFDYLQREALSQCDAGADFLDLNVGIPNCNETELLCKAVKSIQRVCDLPLQLDSSNPTAISQAIRIYNGVPMINSINGSKESLDALLPIIAQYHTPTVALPLNEDGIPESAKGRIAIAHNILSTAQQYGISKHLLIFDGLVMAVSSNQEYGRITLSTLSQLKTMGLLTTIGLSNISFGLPERHYLNRCFLALALNSGLDIPIMNPLDRDTMEVVKSYLALTAQDEQCQSYIKFNTSTQSNDEGEDTLYNNIVCGYRENIENSLHRELSHTNSSDIINSTLIPALKEVGERFEKNLIFMPQLIRSAESAKFAFDLLSKIDEKRESYTTELKPSIILATVKGDVHDIGKNIVRVVVESYGYRVIDLGKDVDREVIYNAYTTHSVIAIGLSALMTTTVESMKETIEYLHTKGVSCPIIVGGAVLTPEIATAIHADYYAKDALTAANILNSITSKE